MSENGTSLSVYASCAMRRGSARLSLGWMLLTAVFARPIRVPGLESTSSLRSLLTRRDMYCCWLPMRARSLPSPMPLRVRRKARASNPLTVRRPASHWMPASGSSMPSPPMHTSMPPIASVMLTTLPKLTLAAKGMLCPVRFETVSATHESPPSSNAVLIEARSVPPKTEPSSFVHSGIATCRSRGNDTTVARRGFAETYSSMLTSLRAPSFSGSVQRGPNAAATTSSHSSVPTTSTEKGSLYSLRAGGSTGASFSGTEASCSRLVSDQAQKPPTATPATRTTAAAIASRASPRRTPDSGRRLACFGAGLAGMG
ncbi:hypothetical protein HR12_08760 [Microbacterium sp. SUBG005]|nr:hypothetical protein HR12_08760 [Microbacterium sp. SUBG005]